MKFFSLLIVPAVVIALGCQSAAQPVKDSKPPAKPKAGNEKPAVVEGKYHKVNFKQLSSYAYEVPDDPISDPKTKALMERNQIPEAIKKLDKQDVAITGFMLPLRVEDGKITEFLILRDQNACCNGMVPKINEWIHTKMPKGKGVKPMMDVMITFYGKLKVGEVFENGYLIGLYEMDGEKLSDPLTAPSPLKPGESPKPAN